MKPALCTRAEFSRLCKVTRATISERCRDMLAGAVVNGYIDLNHPSAFKYLESKAPKRIKELGLVFHDLEKSQENIEIQKDEEYLKKDANEDVSEVSVKDEPKERSRTEYVEASYKKPIASGSRAKLESKKASSLEDRGMINVPENIKDFIDMTLGDLILEFGTDIAFVDWLKATKSIEDINEKRLKNAQTQGELVNRSLVKKTIIEPMDDMLRKLLSDGVKTIARRAIAMHEADRELAEIECFISDIISSFIKPMKSKVSRSFKKITDDNEG